MLSYSYLHVLTVVSLVPLNTYTLSSLRFEILSIKLLLEYDSSLLVRPESVGPIKLAMHVVIAVVKDPAAQ